MTTLAWKGPKEGGVTQSLLTKFQECPYRFYLYAGLGLKEPEIPHPNLVWGSTGHKGLEIIIDKPYTLIDFTPEDWEEIDGIITKYIERFPTAQPTFLPSIKRMLRLYDDSYKEKHGKFETEIPFSEPYTTKDGIEVTLRGKVDGISHDSSVLVEHKCKGKIDPTAKLEIPQDLQVNMYCLVNGPRKVIYDIIRIPDTQFFMPKKRQYQRTENYVDELYDSRDHGDFPVCKRKHLWIQQYNVFLEEEDILNLQAFTLDPLICRLQRWYDHVTQSGFDPDNPKFYNEIFYRTPIRHFDPSRTEKFKCSYYDYLTGTMDFDSLVPVNSFYEELEEDD